MTRIECIQAIALLGLACCFIGCSDEVSPQPDQDVVAEGDIVTSVDDSVGGVDGADGAELADAADVCEHSCLDPSDGKPKKKLCPEPVSDWECTAEGCCEPVFKCAKDEDCLARGFEEGQCEDPRFACRCNVDDGVCYAWHCAVASDCEAGELCVGGACQAPVAATLGLRIVNAPGVLAPGQSRRVLVEAFVVDAPDQVMAASVTWTSSHPDVIGIDDEGLATGGNVAGEATLSAQLVEDPDQNVSVVWRNVATGDSLTVIVTDERNAEAVNALVVLVDHVTGAIVQRSQLSDGVLRYDEALPTGGLDVHVFAEGYDWTSVLAVTGGSLHLPLAPTVYAELTIDAQGDVSDSESILDGVGVVSGAPDFSEYLRDGEIELTLNSLPLRSALFDFNLQALLGADVTRFFHPDANIPGVDTSEPAEMPGGLSFGFAGPALPEFFLAAPPGEHLMWTMGGRLDITLISEYVGDVIDAIAGSSQIDFGRLVNAIIPLFQYFWSGVSPEVAVAGVGPQAVTRLDPVLRVPVTLSTPYVLPQLPDITPPGLEETLWTDSFLILGGVLRGDAAFVPLGINGGVDSSDPDQDPLDGVADSDPMTPEIDPYNIVSAPMHGGLGGPHSRYASAVVATSFRVNGDDPRPDGGSAIITRASVGAPPAEPVTEGFLGFPMERRWDPETRALSVIDVVGADAQRVLFKSRQGKNWSIWLQGTLSYTVPVPQDLVAPDSELADRTDELRAVIVSNFDFSEGSSLAHVLAAGGTSLAELLDVVDRVSFVDIRP